MATCESRNLVPIIYPIISIILYYIIKINRIYYLLIQQPLESICELLDEYSDSKESTQSMQTLQGSNRSTPLNQSPVRFNANKTTLIKQAVKRYTGGSTIVDESSASNIHKYKGTWTDFIFGGN